MRTNLIVSILGATVILHADAQTETSTRVPMIKNIVLVHGAFADGSGWQAVYDVLTQKGYRVTIVQNPLTSLEDDVAATKRILARQDGPTILVGHSYGETVITEAGVDDKVVGLVYVSALTPDVPLSGDDSHLFLWRRGLRTTPVMAGNTACVDRDPIRNLVRL